MHIECDSSPVELRKFDKTSIEKLKKEHPYNYGKNKEPIQNTNTNNLGRAILRFIEKLLHVLFDAWSSLSFLSILIRILLYASFIAIIIYLLFKLFNIRHLIGRNKTIIQTEYDVSNENIHELNFATLIKNAVEEKKYRLAVRLQYLNALKILNDKQYIQWSPEKTNIHYVFELRDMYKNTFSDITYIFDWVWYGEHEISEMEYMRFEQQFNKFNSTIV